MESFLESLSRLKDVHEKEVMGLQKKLLELNSEKYRDAQRMEELFAKNHQLREQQKALKENVRALENRLRAGLCDRCMVTQELARKRQHEFQSSHLQSLQHIFLLTNEMSRLREENESLKKEVKLLRGLDWKVPGGHEGPEAENSSMESREEQLLGYQTPPATRISPETTSLPELKASDMSPQHISNQLHGTIAVVRPGSRACSTDRGSTNGTPPLVGKSSPSSPPYETSLPLDSLLRTSRPSVLAFEALKSSLQADRLSLLSRHLALHLRSPRNSPLAPTTAPGGAQPKILKVMESESWEEPTGLLGLPGALDSRDPQLEGTLHLLLAQQQLRARAASVRSGGLPGPGGTLPSPPAGSDSESPEGLQSAGAALARGAWHGDRCPRPPDLDSLREEEAAVVQAYTPDTPLDLSKPTHHCGLPRPKAGSCSPESPRRATLPAQSSPRIPSPWTLSSGPKGARALELESSTPQRPARQRRRGQTQTDWMNQTLRTKALSSEVGGKLGTPGGSPRCFCARELEEKQQRKRKRASDPLVQATKKFRGRRRPREPLVVAERPGSPQDAEDSSTQPSSQD
ncbi:PREDICTED: RBBP8 N-terminal-like protein [Elephantulus edwardii]|uniref:RBBP8 N-terminal-like protein n=1 Tax=Elephantulus edwardii TaxID=28737 RepID=UPI0003F0D1D6|nr:PREDICTED: RBBP8 N-terminal-like protein [Elephantulus edwardii]